MLAIAFAVLGWVGSSAGRLAVAAIAEREHFVSVSLGDGHLDLVLEHEHDRRPDGVAPPFDPEHVVHLCGSLDVASSRYHSGADIDSHAAAAATTSRIVFVHPPIVHPTTHARAALRGDPFLRATVLLL